MEIVKPVFGVDIDDVLVQCAVALCVYLNKKHEYTITKSDLTTFHFHKLLGVSHEDAGKLIYPFHFSEEHDNCMPIVGAHEAIARLTKMRRPVAITARLPATRANTILLVERLFPGVFTEFHFTGCERPELPHRSKGDVCIEIGAEFMVDDALHNAQSVGEKGVPVYMLDNPWNQCAVLPPNTIRMPHWDDIVEHVERV